MKKLAIASILALTLSACSAADSGDDRVSVMTSMYPAEFLAERIGGEQISITSITPPGADPHETELTPRRTAELLDADVVLWFSNIQPAVDATLAQADRDAAVTVDLSHGGHDHTDDDHSDHDHEDGHSHDDGHDHEGEHSHDEHSHDHGGEDPHTWLDPAAMKANVSLVRDALIAAAPDHEAAFIKNADALAAELDTLHADFEAGLSDCKHRTFITGHAAFGHLAAAFELEQVAAMGVDSHDEPSASDLARIIDLIKDEDITTVLSETAQPDATSSALSRETGAEIAVLNPLEFAPDAGSDYVSVMRENLDSLQQAMECR